MGEENYYIWKSSGQELVALLKGLWLLSSLSVLDHGIHDVN